MSSLELKLKNTEKKFLIELDADKFEKLMADFGYFSREFLESIERSEKDFKAGRVKKIKSLKDLK